MSKRNPPETAAHGVPTGIEALSASQPPEIPEKEYEEPARRRRPLLGAEAALAKAAFEAATTREIHNRLKPGRTVVAVVAVPTAGWVAPISAHIASLSDPKRIARDGSQRTKDLPSEGNDQVLAALAEGRNVVGISQAPDRYLPSTLVASADIAIRVLPPDQGVLKRAIALCLGGRMPKNLPHDFGVGLDFNEIAAALRPGSKPAEAVRRLQVAAKGPPADAASKVVLPPLEEAVFYGKAREWGLSLAADVAEARRTGDWSGVDKGAVFHGEPGTGKTWLARLIARACGLPLIEASVADLFGNSAGFLDSVIKAQRAVFAKAAAMAPGVCVFWDEIEAMPNRATLSPRGRDWWLPVVDDFLLLVSSVPPGVILLGATNHIDLVDAALLRPGRMERAIEIKPPATAEGLAGILRVHLGGDLAGVDLLPIARLGLGATAAVAMDWVRGARRKARTARRAMTIEDLTAAVAPPDERPPDVLRVHAAHEAGHAVATLALGLPPIGFMSLVQDSVSAGRITMSSGDGLMRADRARLERHVTMLLGGRAAEIVLFGSPTLGAGGGEGSDLDRATKLVAGAHCSFGVGDFLAYRSSFEDAREALTYDASLRAVVERDLQRLQRDAVALIEKHRAAVDAVADALASKRFLDGAEVQRLFDAASRSAPPLAPANPSKDGRGAEPETPPRERSGE